MSKWQSERSIHEMLKDTPPLKESSDSITSGTEAKFTTSQSMPFTSAYSPPEPSTSSPQGPSKVASLRDWSLSTYRCTKQMLYEKLGKIPRTVDTELESQIESLRQTQRQYTHLLRLSCLLCEQLGCAQRTQKAMAETMADRAQRDPDLREAFLYNADTQRSLVRNGETLLGALNFFNNSLNTLTNKTIEDTLQTVRQYEAARIEYDAHRTLAGSSPVAGSTLSADDLLKYKNNYERLRDDVAVKIKLLHENRVKVMNKQLLLYHNAVAAYFSGNKVALEQAVRSFSIKTNNDT